MVCQTPLAVDLHPIDEFLACRSRLQKSLRGTVLSRYQGWMTNLQRWRPKRRCRVRGQDSRGVGANQRATEVTSRASRAIKSTEAKNTVVHVKRSGELKQLCKVGPDAAAVGRLDTAAIGEAVPGLVCQWVLPGARRPHVPRGERSRPLDPSLPSSEALPWSLL